jgi:hypothetical protein
MNNNGPTPSPRDPKSPNTGDPNRPNIHEHTIKPIESSSTSGFEEGSRAENTIPPKSDYSNESGTTFSSSSNTPNAESKHLHDEHSKKDYKETFRKAQGKIEDTVKDTIQNIKESEFYHYARSNKEKTITYTLLGIGILLLIARIWFIGGLLVGGALGYHFALEVMNYLRNLRQIFEGPEQVRYIVLTGFLIALLIIAPGIAIGAFIAALIKYFVQLEGNRRRRTSDDKDLDYPDATTRPDDFRNSNDRRK